MDAGVWRYMDLWKFVAILDTQTLHFACADGLDDDWEGGVSEQTLRERPARAAAEAAQVGQTLSQSPSQEQVLAIYEFNSEQMPRKIMVSCWHVGDVESAAMWSLYCRRGEGVAIRSTAGKLIDALPDQLGDSGIMVSSVNYVDYGAVSIPEGNLFDPFTHKRRSFSHEQELRAMLMTRDPEPAGVEVPIEPGLLIEAVYVAPRAPDWHRGVVESLLRSYGLDRPVYKSGLDDPALR